MAEKAEERIAREVDEACPVCAHPHRKLLETEVWGGRPNENVARRYGIGGPKWGGEYVRQHRLQGHMTPREALAGAPLRVLLEEGDAEAAKRGEPVVRPRRWSA